MPEAEQPVMPPSPRDVYRLACVEGRRRLDMSWHEQTSTGFIAGITIVLGITALGTAEALATPGLGPESARIVGAVGFAAGLVFVVVGRTELFSENFFDPVAAAIESHDGVEWLRLVRLWVATLALNLVGGALLLGVVTVDGALPPGALDVLDRIALEIADRPSSALFARAIVAGVLVALLSYLLDAVTSSTARIVVTLIVGVVLALDQLDHAVVSVLHLVTGVWTGASVGASDVARVLGVTVAGNIVGGVGLVTLTHTAQVAGSASVSRTGRRVRRRRR